MIWLVLIYIAAMVAANLLVWWLGPWSSPFIAFTLIGLDLTLRDVLHGRLHRSQLAAVVFAGGLITLLVNPAAEAIAVASSIAFVASALADWAVFSALHRRPWLTRVNGSNAVGALVDSIIFPTLAFGAFLPHIIVLQFIAKTLGGALWSLALHSILLAARIRRS